MNNVRQQVPGHEACHREFPTTKYRTPVARYEQLADRKMDTLNPVYMIQPVVQLV